MYSIWEWTYSCDNGNIPYKRQVYQVLITWKEYQEMIDIATYVKHPYRKLRNLPIKESVNNAALLNVACTRP